MLQFSKYHGLGNDFLILEGRQGQLPSAITDPDPAWVRQVCDRRFGIGGDGVILALPPQAEGDLRMRIFNADGSESEFELPPESGSRLIFIDGKKDKMGLEDGGNLLLETNEVGPSGLGSADKLSLEEATSGISVVDNKIVFETPPTNGQTVSIVNV